ncbi:MAG: GNAT family N-acetyltransferase [Candidatus Poribacteria bacterium]|nr:GNAT family N-acetyltransferase [Candidatus Poribacteria bacterium]
MKGSHLIEVLRPWLDQKLGVPLDFAGADPIPVYESEARLSDVSPLWAIRIGEVGLVTAHRQWADALKSAVASLTSEELFSTFGAYELARVLLPDGIGVWGPSWYLVGDGNCFRPAADARPVQIDAAELPEVVDARIFWHCFPNEAMVGFGIFESGKLVALATVRAEDEDRLWEIGVDVAPETKGRGLGRAVVSSAGRWILEHNRLVLATTAPWNVPSARVLRSVGLQYIMSGMTGMPAPFRVPPQPLGSPYPGAEMRHYYPGWAINKDIKPASED